MNVQALLITLNSISSDSSKNSTLKNLIALVQGLEWVHFIQLIDCYSSDSSKVEAIEILVKQEIKDYVNDYLPCILDNIQSDSSKVKALYILAKFTLNVSGVVVVGITKSISSDSSACKALSTIASHIDTIDNSYVRKVISNISSDSSKVTALQLLVSKMTMVQKDALKIMKNISSDSSTLSAFKTFVSAGLKVKGDKIIDLLTAFSSNSTKVDAIASIGELSEPISDQDKFCKLLAISIDDHDQYLKATNKLNLNDEFVQKYKPEKSSFNTMSNQNFDSNDIPSGVFCISSMVNMTSDGKHEIKQYSNGMTVEIKCNKYGGFSKTVSHGKSNSSSYFS